MPLPQTTDTVRCGFCDADGNPAAQAEASHFGWTLTTEDKYTPTIIRLVTTRDTHPFQWDGWTAADEHYSFRYRAGYLRVDGPSGRLFDGYPDCGCTTLDDLRASLKGVVNFELTGSDDV